ncbi:MAG: gfo/Idh/MocA family oxidoreductase, partial [Planctomycetia bacterium]|nr:gfo/Idh/MocA family oxidoreductase [Planctomycetia bacterium]
RRDGPNERITRDPALLSDLARALSHYPGGHSEGFPDTFKHLAMHVYRWIGVSARGEAVDPPTFPTFEDGHHEAVLCEAIACSALKQAWTDVCDG